MRIIHSNNENDLSRNGSDRNFPIANFPTKATSDSEYIHVGWTNPEEKISSTAVPHISSSHSTACIRHLRSKTCSPKKLQSKPKTLSTLLSEVDEPVSPVNSIRLYPWTIVGCTFQNVSLPEQSAGPLIGALKQTYTFRQNRSWSDCKFVLDHNFQKISFCP